MNFTIDTRDLDRLRQGWARFSDRRFNSGLAEAVNQTAREVRDEWGGQLFTKIDRPTQPTRNAVTATRADVGNLRAEIRLKDQLGSSGAIAPAEYLGTQEFGGDRRAKKFEQALQSRGAMPAGHKVVPGKYAKLDAYGNISRGQIVQVLNQLGSNLSYGYSQVISANEKVRAKAKTRAGREYVAVPVKRGKIAAGVYERVGKNLLPVFFYVSSTRYGRRINLQDHAQVIIERSLPSRINQAMERRLKTLLAREGAAA